MSIVICRPHSLHRIMCCHQFHIIKMHFILGDNIFLHLSSYIEQIGMHKKFQCVQCSPITPVTPGTSLSNGILPQFLKFLLIFMNMQMR